MAYYPSYLIAGGRGVAGYVHDWLSFGDWPSGPAWFIWLLLAFDLVVGAIFASAPRFGDALSRLAENAREHPVRFLVMFVAASIAAYVPMVAVFGPQAWTSIGSFQFQTARVVDYAVLFLGGIGVGAYGIDRGLLASDGKLARHWGRWTLAMLVIFVARIAFSRVAMSRPSAPSPAVANAIGGFVFALTCGTISFALLALFVRFITRRNLGFDSLSDNEYGVYLIHYTFVSWLQMALLAIALGPIAKCLPVFSGVLLPSWGTQRPAPPRTRDWSNRLGAIHRAPQTARAETPAQPRIIICRLSAEVAVLLTDRAPGESEMAAHVVTRLKLSTGQLIEANHSVKLLCAWTSRHSA